MNVEAVNSAGKTAEVTISGPQTDIPDFTPELVVADTKQVIAKESSSGLKEANGDEQQTPFPLKDPTMSTIDSAISKANSRLSKTRCEYSYDEVTRRVSIKVFDKESEELIREVPPEKSLEMLRKMWELAGIVVDEKR